MRDADVIWQAYDLDGDCVQLLRRRGGGGYAVQILSHDTVGPDLYVDLAATDLRELEDAIRREKL